MSSHGPARRRRVLIVALTVVTWLAVASPVWEAICVIPARAIFVACGGLWVGWLVSRSRLAGQPTAPARAAGVHRPAVAQYWEAVPTVQELHRLARHEAAHAAAAWALGAQVASVDVRTVGQRRGQCTFELDDAASPVEAAWVSLVVAVAGHHVDVAGGHHDLSSTSDMNLALTAAAALISTGQQPTEVSCPLTVDGLLSAARGRAAHLLDEHHQLVAAITEHLIAQPGEVWRDPDLSAVAATAGQDGADHPWPAQLRGGDRGQLVEEGRSARS